MLVLCVLLAFMVTLEETVKANPMYLGATIPTVQTKRHALGKSVRFDCNTSHNGNQSLWQRTTSNGYQLLYAAVLPVRDKEAAHIKISPVNYSLLLDSIIINDEGLYNCIQFTKVLASYRLEILVSPEVRIQLEGTNVSDTHFVDKGTELQLACVVFRAKEKPVIEWKIGNTPLKDGDGQMTNSSNRFTDGTFDFGIPLTYVIKHDTNLVCSSYADYNKSVSVIISTGRHPNAENSSNYTALIVGFLLVFFVAVSGGGWLCLRRFQGSPLSIMIRVSNIEGTSQLSGTDGIDSNIKVTPYGSDVQNKSSRRLPEVPNQKPSYARNIGEEEDYSAVSYNLPASKVFLRKRICLISRLSDGVICERWVGNVTANDGQRTCALISRLKGIIYFEHFSWDKLVKRLLELPENPHIFKVMGMSFDEPNLYLLQDYMTCESLAEYLSITTLPTEALFTSKLTNISLQVCYGMEFAMTFGLSHPGLSMKKILINESGICKLYDFCLTEDASKFLDWLKSESDFLPTNHPPECVTTNEYTCASDVWYTSFSILEIYSYGKRRNRLKTATHGNKRIPSSNNLDHERSETYSLQPQLCPTIVYERIKKCMTPNENDRLKTVKELVTVLKELCSTSVSNSSAQVEKKTGKYSSYVPMIDGSEEVMYSLPVKYNKVIV